MKRIEELLRETMGLDAASIGATSIHRTARLRMKSLGLKRMEDYHQLLAKSRVEWNELVESVIVTETWFFRDREPFGALVRLVFEEWLPAHPTAPLRLLSLPCSSGEEPYSLAMIAREVQAGMAVKKRVEIEGVDASDAALEKARRGRYTRCTGPR